MHLVKINNGKVKQLLNFTEKECEEYDFSELYKGILAINGNDASKLFRVRLFVQTDNKKETLKFFSQKRKESAIKKRMFMALNSVLTGKRDNDLYEIEVRDVVENIKVSIGAIKFHAQENFRIVCREYPLMKEIIIVMIEACPKKGQRNSDDAAYNNKLNAAKRIRHYYKEKDTGNKIFIQ